MSDQPTRFRPRLVPRIDGGAGDDIRPARPGTDAPAPDEAAPDILESDRDLAAFVSALQTEMAGNPDAAFQADDDQRREHIRQRSAEYNDRRVRSGSTALPAGAVDVVVDRLIGFGFLEPFLTDARVTEIMVNGRLGVFVERGGQPVATRGYPTEEEVQRVAARLLARCHRHMVSEARPYQDGFLPDLRVNVVHGSVTPQGTVLTLRKHRTDFYDLTTLVKLGALPRDASEFCELLVVGRASLLVSGGTGSGKTTFVNALINVVPRHERVILVEDALELNPKEIPNRVSLISQPDTPEARSRFTTRDAVRQALRMRPNRIVVGEVRGPEALDMLWAMNTGHEGSLTTLHANSARDALGRLELYCFEGAGENFPQKVVRSQISSGIDIIVHVARLQDGSRKVVEVAELTRVDQENGQYVLESLWLLDRSGHEPELRPTARMVSSEMQERLRNNGVNVDHLRRLVQRPGSA